MQESRISQFYRWLCALPFGAHGMILILLGILSYFNAIAHPFVHDDLVFIGQNPFIHRWDNISDAFLKPSMPLFFDGLVTPYYRPMLEVIYRLQYFFFGFNATAFHAVNVIFHLINGLIVCVLMRRLTQSNLGALAIALIFLVHPVQSEAVACVSGISNVLGVFFMLTSFWAYLQARDSSQGRILKFFWFLGAVVCFVCGLLTKELVVILPGILLMYEYLFNPDFAIAKSAPKGSLGKIRRGFFQLCEVIPAFCLHIFVHSVSDALQGSVAKSGSNQQDNKEGRSLAWYRLAIFMLVVIGFLVWRNVLFGNVAGAVFENMGELQLRLLSIAQTFGMYVRLTLFPFGLHYYRSVDILTGRPWHWLIFFAATAMVVLYVRRMRAPQKNLALLGLGWFFLGLLPVLNIIPLVNEFSFVAAFEHNLYWPLLGLLLFCHAVFCQYALDHPAIIKKCSTVLAVFLCVVMLILIMMTMRQNTFWRGEIALFERVSLFQPQLGRVRILLANAYLQNNRVDDALKELIAAQTIISSYIDRAHGVKARHFYAGLLKGIYTTQALAHSQKANWAQAVDCYTRAIGQDPHDSVILIHRALALIQVGNLDGAVEDLRRALRIEPHNVLAANNLGICYIQQKEYAKARRIFENVLSREPGFRPARENLEKLKESHPYVFEF